MENSKLIIRDARDGELNEVAQVLRAAYQQYDVSIPPHRWEAYLRDIMDVRSRLGISELIVAELKGSLAGAVTLFLKGSDAMREGWPPGWAGIRLLGTHPDYRGRGIGRALMEECIRRCRAAGIKTIGLHTTEIMEVARGMYERMGFIRTPEFDFRPAPDLIVMAYRLDL